MVLILNKKYDLRKLKKIKKGSNPEFEPFPNVPQTGIEPVRVSLPTGF